MSAPASSVYSNDDAHTIAPSEASLNRRWYTQIKQWTHQLPPDDQEEAVTLLERNVEQRTRRPRVANEDGEGTEVGTVAPGHSISRRASREYRQGQMSVEETERRPESQVLVAEKTEVMPSTSINKKDSTLHMESVKTIKNKQPERPVSTSVHQSSPSKAQGRQSTLIISAEETEDLHTPRPKRGRRPPTPFHPPSDLALSEVPEEEESLVGIEEALFAKGKRESGFERDAAAAATTSIAGQAEKVEGADSWCEKGTSGGPWKTRTSLIDLVFRKQYFSPNSRKQ
ncbi:hypothetical protein QFC24_006584 [Naganishia onofrii]|uniref:Uncharacterized protein n=1 Tax=Naganishia onofrii TaxID=1851511 RepID=A0ACC2X0M8_9TREE|nr:hypothetical protein QFC24_006584 [Naganishia onofrii]